MTVGAPDYGQTSGQSNETSNTDILELASRLGCIASVNRAGQQIISVNECMLYSSIMYYSSTANAIFKPSYRCSLFNRPSLKVITGSQANELAGLNFNHLPFGSGQIGQTGYFIAGSFMCSIQMNIHLVNSGTVYYSGVSVNLNTGQVYVNNQAGGSDLIGTYSVPNSYGEPIVLKYTVNYDTMKYGDLYYGSEPIVDLSAHSAQKYTQAIPDMSLIWCGISNIGAVSNNIYINDCIITINEVV